MVSNCIEPRGDDMTPVDFACDECHRDITICTCELFTSTTTSSSSEKNTVGLVCDGCYRDIAICICDLFSDDRNETEKADRRADRILLANGYIPHHDIPRVDD